MNNFDLIKKLAPKAFVELMFSLIKEYNTEKELLCLLEKEIPQKTLESRDFQYFLKYLNGENGYSCETAFLLFSWRNKLGKINEQF